MYMPYLKLYTSLLDELQVAYDVLYWDRLLKEEGERPNLFRFRFKDRGWTRRLQGYLGFRRSVAQHLKKHQYDLFILFTTQIGVLVRPLLGRAPYLLDLCDYRHEAHPVYRYLAGRVIRQSALTCISSPGHERWLPPGPEYLIAHDFDPKRVDYVPRPFNPRTKIISYIGLMPYYQANVKFIAGVARCPEVTLRYAGKGLGTCEERLADYCRKRGISNVEFLGGWEQPHEKDEYYLDTNFTSGY